MFMVLWSPPLLQRLRANAIVLFGRGVAWRRAALVHGRYHRSFSRAPRDQLGWFRARRFEKKKNRVRVACSTRRVHRTQNTVRGGVAIEMAKGKTEAGTYGLDGANKQRCINPKRRQCCVFVSLEVKEEVRRILASDQRAAAWDHSSRHAGRSTSTGGNLEASDGGGLGLGWGGEGTWRIL